MKYIVFYEDGIPFFSIKAKKDYIPPAEEGITYKEFSKEEWGRRYN